jgi:prepilin-type N-terminal cleavage/methylation domain-containing protein
MRKDKGFTLVEMLLVMGIIVILMSIGIAVGRYAIARSNRIQHQNAADELYRALLVFKNDNGFYPKVGNCGTCIEEEFFAEAMGYIGEKNYLEGYLGRGSFDGGTDATYYYYSDPSDSQLAIVCVSLGGIDDESQLGHYCIGDGIGYLPESAPINSKDIGNEEEDRDMVNSIRSFDQSDWVKDIGFSSN